MISDKSFIKKCADKKGHEILIKSVNKCVVYYKRGVCHECT
jgi:hypothetical protein